MRLIRSWLIALVALCVTSLSPGALILQSSPLSSFSNGSALGTGGTSQTPPKTKSSTKKSSHRTTTSGKKKKSRKIASRRPHGQMKPDPQRTREIQEKLIEAGAMSGPANGVWDPKGMGDSIRKFQEMKGLNPTGKLDVKTLKAMGLKS